MQVAMPEYMRVRAYLYKLIMDSDGESLKIPPENELCRLFNVSRFTVRGAIKGLVDDKFLIPRRGLGTFINHKKIKNIALRKLFVGLLKGDGKHSTNTFDSAIGDCVLQSGMNFESVYLPESNKSETLLEIAKNSLNGLIWQNSNSNIRFNKKFIDALLDDGPPVLQIENSHPLPLSDYICSSQPQRGEAIADYMFSRGHSKVLFIHADDSSELHLNPHSTYNGYFQRIKKLSGGKKCGTFEDGVISILDLKKRLAAWGSDKSKFTAVYSGYYLVSFVMDELRAVGISVPDDLSYLVFGDSNPFFFNGLSPDSISDKKPLQNAILEWLKLRIADTNRSGVFTKNINAEIITGETIKNLNGGKANV